MTSMHRAIGTVHDLEHAVADWTKYQAVAESSLVAAEERHVASVQAHRRSQLTSLEKKSRGLACSSVDSVPVLKQEVIDGCLQLVEGGGRTSLDCDLKAPYKVFGLPIGLGVSRSGEDGAAAD